MRFIVTSVPGNVKAPPDFIPFPIHSSAVSTDFLKFRKLDEARVVKEAD
jgi:hypothetical protein